MLPRSPVEERRIASALAQVRAAARHYWQVRPHPFGHLQTSIRDAKLHGATCEEIALTLRHVGARSEHQPQGEQEALVWTS